MVVDPVQYGRLVALLPEDVRKKLSKVDIEKMIRKLKPMTDTERAAIEYASNNIGEHIRGLKDSMLKDVRTVVSGQALQAIRDSVVTAIEERKTPSELKTMLFDKFDDRNRDWRRVASTELNDAIQFGIAAEIKRTSDEGADQLVFKRPNDDACPKCRFLYLESGIPKIFRLKDLAMNNVGRKSADWVPTLLSTHPWCFVAGHRILTRRGLVAIESVLIGDEVLTHKSRWRKVSAFFEREWSGDLVVIDVGGKILKCTPEHPFLSAGRWVLAKDLCERDSSLEIVTDEVMFKKVNNKPSMFRKIPEFVGILGRFFARGVPVSHPSAIVRIKRQGFSGKVYNLGIEEDESYVCEGVVSHNCACQLHVLPEGFGFKKKNVVAQKFEDGGKIFNIGQEISESEIANLSAENKTKIRQEAILEFEGERE
jgi:hypothetical protein